MDQDSEGVGGMSKFFSAFYDEIRERLDDTNELGVLCAYLKVAKTRGNKVIIAGNGGSAAISSHVSVDLVKMLGIRAMAFSDSDLITCFANDYGYENWLSEAINSYGDPGDLAILISSSGKSSNILNAAGMAKLRGMTVVTLSGFAYDNPLRIAGDLNLWANSQVYNIVETVHQTWLLSAIDCLANG